MFAIILMIAILVIANYYDEDSRHISNSERMRDVSV